MPIRSSLGLKGFNNLVGFGAGVRALSFVDSASSTGASVTIPAIAAVGDVAILVDYVVSFSAAVTKVVPSGWTELVDTAGTAVGDYYRVIASYRILTSGQPGASVTGMNEDGENKLMLVFRHANGISSITPSTWNSEIGDGDLASQAANASGGTAPLIVIGAACIEGGTASFSTASPAFDDTVASSDADILMGYKLYDNSPANHTIDMNDLGNNNALVSGYLQITV